MPKNIALFSDGTGNSSAKAQKTNVWRLYQDHLEAAPKSFRPELHLPGLFPLFFHPGVLDVVEAFLGPEIRLYPVQAIFNPKVPAAA